MMMIDRVILSRNKIAAVNYRVLWKVWIDIIDVESVGVNVFRVIVVVIGEIHEVAVLIRQQHPVKSPAVPDERCNGIADRDFAILCTYHFPGRIEKEALIKRKLRITAREEHML